MKIRKVSEGAYFVPSYSEQTVLSYQPLISNQTITVKGPEDEGLIAPLEEEGNFTKEDFEKALKRISHKEEVVI